MESNQDNQSENNNQDNLTNSDLGGTKDFNNLSFNEEKNTFEVDVKGEEKEYDHPFGYDTPSDNGADFNSDFDEANPYIGDEYAKPEDAALAGLDDSSIHIDHGQSVKLDPVDELLARTPEDDRTDLDEEGYPINDQKDK